VAYLMSNRKGEESKCLPRPRAGPLKAAEGYRLESIDDRFSIDQRNLVREFPCSFGRRFGSRSFRHPSIGTMNPDGALRVPVAAPNRPPLQTAVPHPFLLGYVLSQLTALFP